VVSGIQVRQDIYRCTAFIEKPDLQTARQRLTMIGLPKDTFLAHCGIYIFTPEIFNCISKIRTQALNAVREVELAEAQIKLLKKYPDKYFLYKIAGRAYDIGTAEGYVEAQAILRRK
jgi:UTP-glucose-1-phosphate uridylyltransferase